jgi:ribonuclease D
MSDMNITLHHGDLPADLKLGNLVAMDCEMMGLNPIRDKLCLVQISDNGKDAHLVKFDISKPYNAPNLVALLNDETKTKMFHFAVVDMQTLIHHLKAEPKNIYCTKMASKLVRTYTDKHSLKYLVPDLIGVELSKEQQLTHWGVATLSSEQLEYAATDVKYLHKLKEILDKEIAIVNRTEILAQINNFIPTLAKLELQGWDSSILNHH